jgi:hypothetical protein
VTSFQQIIRYVSLGARLSTIIQGANVDNVEQMNILLTMSKCLQRQAKESDIRASDLRSVLEDKLLKEITIRFVDKINEPANSNFVKDILIYDLCGYMIHTRKSLSKCPDCYKSLRCEELELPEDFTADHYTRIRNKGFLIFVTVNMFQTFRVMEKVIEGHFEPIGQMYVEESFQECMEKISTCHLVPIFCDIHRDEKLPYLIREYVGVRYHFESKRLKNLLLAEASANVKKKQKIGKTCVGTPVFMKHCMQENDLCK